MEIIFAGGSHYGKNGLISIQNFFDKVYILNSGGADILELARPQDVVITSFNEVECKYVFLCGYAQLLSEQELAGKTFINVHGALLPKYRGMHSTFYAIMNGEKELGITFHLVDKNMDSGDIIKQFKIEYKGQSVSEINELYDKLVEENAGSVCNGLINGILLPYPQDDSLATYGAKRNLDDCYIDFKMKNEYLRRFFLALTPIYPRPMIKFRGRRYEIVGDYKIVDMDYYGPDGRAVNVSDEGVWIKVKDGYLIIKRIRDYETGIEYDATQIIPIGYRFQ